MAGFETSMGGTLGDMPATQWEQILAHAPESAAWRAFLNEWVGRCWKPIYRYIRSSWGAGNEEAKDLTQEFLTHFLDRDYLSAVRPERGRLRSYVWAALRNFLTNRRRDEGRLKRGGDRVRVPLEDVTLAEEAGDADPAAEFDRAWRRAVLADAIATMGKRLAAGGKSAAYEVFCAYYLHPEGEPDPTYDDLAVRLGMTEGEVRHALVAARKTLRDVLREQVRRTVQDETEAEAELRELFGA